MKIDRKSWHYELSKIACYEEDIKTRVGYVYACVLGAVGIGIGISAFMFMLFMLLLGAGVVYFAIFALLTSFTMADVPSTSWVMLIGLFGSVKIYMIYELVARVMKWYGSLESEKVTFDN